MSSVPKDIYLLWIYCFLYQVMWSPRSHYLNVLYNPSLEIRELFLFTVFLKFISILPFLFSANGCAKKRMPSVVLVPISYPTGVALFVLNQLKKLEFHSLIGIEVSSDILSKWKLQRLEAYTSDLSTLDIYNSLMRFRTPWLPWAGQLQVRLYITRESSHRKYYERILLSFIKMKVSISSLDGHHCSGLSGTLKHTLLLVFMVSAKVEIYMCVFLLHLHDRHDLQFHWS